MHLPHAVPALTRDQKRAPARAPEHQSTKNHPNIAVYEPATPAAERNGLTAGCSVGFEPCMAPVPRCSLYSTVPGTVPGEFLSFS
ncbi:hypothetical protein M7I_6598 [Glarea lozoyensis 74030]|uniref:Uncharacterized protein n=1 Tax=Glarea lozoyensis (strain ATCC 74030 / MF5533) TaxID=1104152 RepID=H0EV06_GLAL7|nr:hypothetical protein M7I_6598 [Glarea lozoyensis 74030]